MSTPTYSATAFLQGHTDFEIGEAERRLRERLSWLLVTRSAEKAISVSEAGWTLRLYLAEEPHVAEEAAEMPDLFPNLPRVREIEVCKRRVDIRSTEPDPDLAHFNDYLFVCEVVEGFAGVILFDPQTGESIGSSSEPPSAPGDPPSTRGGDWG